MTDASPMDSMNASVNHGSSENVSVLEKAENEVKTAEDEEGDEEEYGDEAAQDAEEPAADENKDHEFEPSYKEMSLTYEQKLALKNGVVTWDSKFTKLIDVKNKELDEKMPTKKK